MKKYSKKKLYLLLLLSASLTASCLYMEDKIKSDDFNSEEKDPDIDEAKVICRFKNCNDSIDNDVVTFINDNDEIYAILGIDNSNDKNENYIYLPKGHYKICSSLGLKSNIYIDDVDDIYEIVGNYYNNTISIFKNDNQPRISNSFSILNDNNTNYISSDLNFFSNNTESNNLDYSNIKKDGYTAQGYVIVGGTNPYTLISSYSHNKRSRIYIYDRKTGNYLGYIILNNYDHVGGITYDPENDILFVTATDGKINTYDYSVLMSAFNNGINNIDGEVIIDLYSKSDNNQNNDSVIIENDLNVLQSASTICYYDGYLYSIDYGIHSILVKSSYSIINNKVVSISNEVSIPEGAKCIQGMGFYQKDDKIYLVLASSAGFLNSKIGIYEEDDDYRWKCVGKKIIGNNTRMEGISIDKHGNISTIYEGSIVKSKLAGNVNNIIKNTTNIDGLQLLNDFAYDINGVLWDFKYHDDLSLNKAKKLVKKQ